MARGNRWTPDTKVDGKRRVLRALKRSPLGALLRNKHVYCVGLPKSGTHSVADLFGRCLRAAHEPFEVETIRLIEEYECGSISEREVAAALRARDRELRLELESSNLLARFSPVLADVYPYSHFILTVRHPRSWLESVFNHCINNPTAQGNPWRVFRRLNWGEIPTHRPPEERILDRYGLHSVDACLSYWKRHLSSVLRGVPEGRLLVLPVEHLSRSLEDLALFVGVRLEDLWMEGAHSYRAPREHGVLQQIPSDYLARKLDEHCGSLVRSIYGEQPSRQPRSTHEMSPTRAGRGSIRPEMAGALSRVGRGLIAADSS